MTERVHDLAVIGAGPAGASAALLAARHGHRVVLIDRETFPRTGAAAGWLNARVSSLLKEMGIAERAVGGVPVAGVTFHSADFTKSSRPALEHAPVYLVDRVHFGNVLVEAVRKQGVSLVEGRTARDVRLLESSVMVELDDGKAIEARLLLLATGPRREMFHRLGIAMPRGGTAFWTAQVGHDVSTSSRSPAHVHVVLGMDRGGSFGLICASPRQVSITLHWLGAEELVHPKLMELCAAAHAQGLVSQNLASQVRSVVVTRSPASVALDMESHVGKHTLLIGDAGGFVSAVSNEGLYPAIWSAKIAVGVIEQALAARHSQDELMAFDTQWRMAMADYLRPPNTDPQFLLPLVFSNQAMSDRMAGAFFTGENI